jgi:hypothetical protein
LLKGLKKLLALLQKVIGHPFDHFAGGICELHATPIILAIYRWENLIQKKKEASLKFCLPSAVFILTRAYPTIPLSAGATVPLNMELDLQSLFGLHVNSCTHLL